MIGTGFAAELGELALGHLVVFDATGDGAGCIVDSAGDPVGHGLSPE